MNDTAQTGLHPHRAVPARPQRDSTRIHIVLLRFGAVSLSSAVIDNLVFYLVFHASGTIAGAQLAARTISVLFNYFFVRRVVFFSDHAHQMLLPRYLLLVGVNAAISYAGIRLLSGTTALSVMESKILTETLLFGANFAFQRAWVFTRRVPDANSPANRSSLS